MTQIWSVSVCLLKLSLLYPAPHMETTMLRISPSFLTKPSEQPAKNNMKCCLLSWPRPPGEDITGRRRSPHGLEPVRLWPPRLQLIQNTDQSCCCTRGVGTDESRGRLYISGAPLYILWPERDRGGTEAGQRRDRGGTEAGQRRDRGHPELFSDTKHVPTEARDDPSFNRPDSLPGDRPRTASLASLPQS